MDNVLAGHSGSYFEYPLEDALEGIAAAGFGYVELAAGRSPHAHATLEATGEQTQALKARLAHYGLQASSLSGHSDLTTPGGLADGKRALDLCERLGIRIMNTAIGGSAAQESEDLVAFLANIGDLASYAEARGIVVALEVHGPIMATAALSAPIIERIGRANVRINYDTANCMFYGGVRAEDDIGQALPYLAHVHLKDAGGGLREWNFPPIGQGQVDFGRVFRILASGRYAGPLSVEIEFYGLPWPPVEEVHRAMRMSYQHLRGLWTKT